MIEHLSRPRSTDQGCEAVSPFTDTEGVSSFRDTSSPHRGATPYREWNRVDGAPPLLPEGGVSSSSFPANRTFDEASLPAHGGRGFVMHDAERNTPVKCEMEDSGDHETRPLSPRDRRDRYQRGRGLDLCSGYLVVADSSPCWSGVRVRVDVAPRHIRGSLKPVFARLPLEHSDTSQSVIHPRQREPTLQKAWPAFVVVARQPHIHWSCSTRSSSSKPCRRASAITSTLGR